MRRTLALTTSILGCALLLSACGSASSTAGSSGSGTSGSGSATTGTSPSDPTSGLPGGAVPGTSARPPKGPSVPPTPIDPPGSGAILTDSGTLLVAQGTLMQKTATSPVEFCVGAIAESYPPQCGGPAVIGDVDWGPLKTERASGATWASGVWAVGRLAPGAGGSRTFTLDRPVSLTPPAGVRAPQVAPMTFPQLCDDPYAAGGRSGAGSTEEQNRLGARLETLDGVIGSWVSGGSSMFNVLVTGDADRARAELRKIWPGGLCVEQRDLATLADVRSAQSALDAAVPGLLGSGGDATQGVLEVQVLVLDQDTHDAILRAVGPWLTAKDVRITGSFQPLPE